MPRFSILIGMNGVSDHENARARKMGMLFEAPMLLLAIWVVVVWYIERKALVSANVVWLSDAMVWFFFLLETLVLTYLVNDKSRHLLNNWMNLIIILAGLPVILEHNALAPVLRSFRLLLLLALFINMFSTLRTFLGRNNLGITLGISLSLMVIVGIFISVVDPGIETPADGLWWAWVTITTVGYGDVVPTSPTGRAIGSALILVGFGLFSLLTASISAFMITRDEEDAIDREEGMINREEILIEKLTHISDKLERLEQRLESLEAHNLKQDSNHQ